MPAPPRQQDAALTSALASASLYCPPEAAAGSAIAVWIVHMLGARRAARRQARQSAPVQVGSLPAVTSEVPIV